MTVGGIHLIGINAQTGEKALLTLILVLALAVVRAVYVAVMALIYRRNKNNRVRFWLRQALNLLSAIVLVLGLISIWFDNPANLAVAFGLFSAGLGFALQRVILSMAAYVVILRGKMFNVGDRIAMGGVRGDVIALDLIQTTIMEMGQPPPVQSAEPPVWVEARQFTGRIVTVANSTIFEQPVYNYSREFPLIWEEMRLPIAYTDDRAAAESILLDVAKRATDAFRAQGEAALRRTMERYAIEFDGLEPHVFYRITDNWLELTVRFVTPPQGVRGLKDRMSREILTAFDARGIGIASSTYDIVGFPPVRIAGAPDGREGG